MFMVNNLCQIQAVHDHFPAWSDVDAEQVDDDNDDDDVDDDGHDDNGDDNVDDVDNDDHDHNGGDDDYASQGREQMEPYRERCRELQGPEKPFQ